ncbi:hypothetical protein GCM10027590_44610 [Nocardiopsis nanhaiensis]
MDHGRGRHRKRRRGWVSRARWTVGAVLAAILNVSTPPPPTRPRPGKKSSTLRAETTSPAVLVPQEPEWARRYDRARREHTDRVRNLYEPQRTAKRLPTFGWCEDDQGGRGVRPYLAAHEQRHRAQQSPAVELRKHGRDQEATFSAATATQAPTTGEWDELAGLVWQWHAQQHPVA